MTRYHAHRRGSRRVRQALEAVAGAAVLLLFGWSMIVLLWLMAP
jgi:hypothetical protein